jgi:hypothetical protein
MLPQNAGIKPPIYVLHHSKRGKTSPVPQEKPEISFIICYVLHLTDDVCTLSIGPDDAFSIQITYP